ncbi:MAG: sulfatase-like hydrolase/transferase [Candidatus Eisenbacteria sp.]|nr:sulfatase-like hydrolase/transferase [Candidatus Eisenbacteria bacterium]
MKISAKRWIVVLWTAAALLALLGCGNRGPKVARDNLNILLITLDTTRSDQLGCYGNTKGLTPNLDALAAEGTLFEEVVSPVPLTLPAHASMLTGLNPIHHGVRINGWFLLAEDHITVPEILKDEGFATGAVISAYVLDHQFQLNQGFDLYDDDLSRGFQKTEFSTIERRGDAVTASGLKWLEDHRDQRFFLWLHYYDPHHPYDPPAGFDIYGLSDFEHYQGEIAFMDDQIGQVLARLKELGLYDRTVVMAVGDHGEAFGRHEEYGHGLLIYGSTISVPLIMRLPGIEGISSRPGRRVGGRISLVDITPTLLDILGLELPGPMDGHSLVPCIEGRENNPQWPIYCETAQGKLTRNWSQLSCIIVDDWKYTLAPTDELYNLSEDPLEQRNLSMTLPSEAERMKNKLVELITRPASLPGTSTFEMDAEAEERLRSLGYISASSIPDEQLEQITTDLVQACQTGKDPKDMMAYNNLVTSATTYLTRNQPGRALRTLKEARDMAGGDVDIQLLGHMAGAYVQLKLFDAAIETHREIIKRHPDEVGMRNNMALAYHSKGESSKAIEILRDVLERSSKYYEYYLNLANVYDDLRRFEMADPYYDKALELAPVAAGKREEVRFNIALSYQRRGRTADARDLLEAVLEVRPEHSDARALLETVNEQLRAGRS